MKITSAEQILKNCKWLNPNLLVFDLFSDLMSKSFLVELDFNPQKEQKIIRKQTLDSIIEFQNLQKEDLDNIHNTIWMYVNKYKSEADLRHLDISTKNEIINKSKISGVGFINEDELDHTFFYIFIDAGWDLEHGVTISYCNGKLDDIE